MKQCKNWLYPWEAALLLASCAALLSGVWAQGRSGALEQKLVRLHVIAASDSAEDQATKLLVRDAILAEVTPLLAQAADAAEAEETLRSLLPALARMANEVSGASARAELGREQYPTREYENFSLPAGAYTSLRVTLGEGQGHNWWCVVYPPLCFASAEEVRETSALTEEEIAILTEEDEGYVLKFRILEWWGEIKNQMGFATDKE